MVTDPSGTEKLSWTDAELENGTAAGTVKYTYLWKYPKGLDSGSGYTATVAATDQDGNNYTQEISFGMADSGVYLLAQDRTLSGIPGDTVEFMVSFRDHRLNEPAPAVADR